MISVINTGKSQLLLHPLEPERFELVKSCVETVDPLLIHNPPIMVYGKLAHQRRSIGFFSNESTGYFYSRQLMRSQPLPECLLTLLGYINQKFNYNFNGILVNKYIDGNDTIGRHSDDEALLDMNVGVIAISFGAVRTFRIRNKITNQIEVDIPTNNDQIIQMSGDFQKEFTHEIPVQKRITQPRFSLTFRRHNY